MLAKIALREALTVSSKLSQGKFYLTFSFMANLSRFCGFMLYAQTFNRGVLLMMSCSLKKKIKYLAVA